MTTKVNMNGQARKSLAEQIDRLDEMLDGLADGLNDAIAAAVKDAVGMAVQQAVQVVMREMLSSPELLARLGAAVPAAAPAQEKTPKAKASWKRRWLGVYKTLAGRLNAGRIWCGRRLQGVRSQASGLLQQARILVRFRNQFLVAASIGLTVGVMAYMAGPWLSAAAGGLGGFAASLAVQLGLSVRRLLTAVAVQ
jgi:hypothetical protein